MDDFDARTTALDRAVGAGAERALDSFRGTLAVETKDGPLDAVTAVDREVQATVAETLESEWNDPLVGEEGSARKTVPETGSAWIVDPIDGTLNYVAGNRTWATSLALVADGEPLAAINAFPALGDRVRAGRHGAVTRNGEPVTTSDCDSIEEFVVGTIFGYDRGGRDALADAAPAIIDACGDLRRLGSAQVTLSMVATGELDAAVATVALAPWDTVAGVHLVRRAGGRVTDLDGDRWHHDDDALIASNGDDAAHRRLIEILGGGR